MATGTTRSPRRIGKRFSYFLAVPNWVSAIFPYAAFWNLLLGVFNLIPVPPLDGYNIIRPAIPLGARRQADAFARSGTIALLVAIIVASVVFRYLADPLSASLGFLLPRPKFI